MADLEVRYIDPAIGTLLRLQFMVLWWTF